MKLGIFLIIIGSIAVLEALFSLIVGIVGAYSTGIVGGIVRILIFGALLYWGIGRVNKARGQINKSGLGG